ncbi:helix-turn-helix domain-containing protein [Streptomyces sodiiphilus]|uniref:Helix-turn-helix domain-containing protein n=1 Tax=Streptomyces sodiiphilus TaxID=226217 RepID=A0ABP5ADD0_9ACTN
MAQQAIHEGAVAALELLAAGAQDEHLEEALEEQPADGKSGAGQDARDRVRRAVLQLRRRLESVQQRSAALTFLLDTAVDLAEQEILADALAVLTRRARMLLGADMACVALGEGAALSGPLVVRAAGGHLSPLTIGLRVPEHLGLGQRALESAVPVWTSDFLTDHTFEHRAVTDDMVRAEGLRAVIATPLVHASRHVGVLYTACRAPRQFSREEVALMSTLGELGAAAVVRGAATDAANLRLRNLPRDQDSTTRQLLKVSADSLAGRQLIQAALEGAGPAALTRKFGRHMRAAVRVCAPDGEILAETGELPGQCGDLIAAATRAHARGHAVRHPDGAWTTVVFAGEQWLSSVHVRCARSSPRPDQEAGGTGTARDNESSPGASGSEEATLGNAAHGGEPPPLLTLFVQALAVSHLVAPAAGVTASQDRAELLRLLLDSTSETAEALTQRASRLGVNLRQPYVMLAARPQHGPAGSAQVWAVSHAQRTRGLHLIREDCVILMLPGRDPNAAAHAVSSELSQVLGQPVTVGSAGPSDSPESVPSIFREARRCLEAMAAMGATGVGGSAADVGLFGLLLSRGDDVPAFLDATIGPLIRYDKQHLSELTGSLEAYFNAGGSPTHAAKLLHVHPNTVSRRLERIGELLGPEWQSPERALHIQLALRILHIGYGLRSGS